MPAGVTACAQPAGSLRTHQSIRGPSAWSQAPPSPPPRLPPHPCFDRHPCSARTSAGPPPSSHGSRDVEPVPPFARWSKQCRAEVALGKCTRTGFGKPLPGSASPPVHWPAPIDPDTYQRPTSSLPPVLEPSTSAWRIGRHPNRFGRSQLHRVKHQGLPPVLAASSRHLVGLAGASESRHRPRRCTHPPMADARPRPTRSTEPRWDRSLERKVPRTGPAQEGRGQGRPTTRCAHGLDPEDLRDFRPPPWKGS